MLGQALYTENKRLIGHLSDDVACPDNASHLGIWGHEETSVSVNHLKIGEELVPTRTKNLLCILCLFSLSANFQGFRNSMKKIKEQKF